METVLFAMFAGSLRVSTPFLFVSIGECLTEKSGRINLGNEGVLVLGAMVAYATSYETGSPWLGVLVEPRVVDVFKHYHSQWFSLPLLVPLSASDLWNHNRYIGVLSGSKQHTPRRMSYGQARPHSSKIWAGTGTPPSWFT